MPFTMPLPLEPISTAIKRAAPPISILAGWEFRRFHVPFPTTLRLSATIFPARPISSSQRLSYLVDNCKTNLHILQEDWKIICNLPQTTLFVEGERHEFALCPRAGQPRDLT